jgi:hypothetical protein
MRRIDLAHVLLSQEAVAGWQETAKRAARVAASLGIDPATIPDEQAGILRNGSLKIYVVMDGVEVSMIVPPEQWSHRMPQN